MTEGYYCNVNIEYIETDQQGLDSIGFLWEKLNEHHRARSPHHAGHFSSMTFNTRKKGLLQKTEKGFLRIDIAKDVETGNLVGYCITSVTEDKQGEVESIFVESDYRRHGIGDNFMKKALKWLDSMSISKRIISVAIGNEETFPFYAKYGFYPRVTILRQVETEED
jgi:GNAT superfamily N-acetyltransferase